MRTYAKPLKKAVALSPRAIKSDLLPALEWTIAIDEQRKLDALPQRSKYGLVEVDGSGCEVMCVRLERIKKRNEKPLVIVIRFDGIERCGGKDCKKAVVAIR